MGNMHQRIPAKIVEVNGKCRPELTPWNRRNLDNLIASLNGKEVWISIKRQTKQRSNPQNSYLWGVVYEAIKEETDMDKDSIHAWAKNEFLRIDGEGLIPHIKSTSKLTTVEFNWFIDSLIQWASQFLGVYIPLPNEEEMWGGLLNEQDT